MGHLDDSGLEWWSAKTETMHNVPVKLAMELGVGAGLAWLLATGLALQKYNRHHRHAYEQPSNGLLCQTIRLSRLAAKNTIAAKATARVPTLRVSGSSSRSRCWRCSISIR